jgi:hypothetical protein
MFLIPVLISGVVSGVSSVVLAVRLANLAALTRGSVDHLWRYILDLLPALLFLGIVSWVMSTLASGVCMRYASDITNKGHAEIGDAFRFTVRKLVSLLAAQILVVLLVVLGFIALIVPGIVLALMFSLVEPVIIAEDIGVLKSLSRSRKLVAKRWWKTLAWSLIVGTVVGILRVSVGLISLPFGLFGGFVRSIVTAVVAPISPICQTVYYYSMLAREQESARDIRIGTSEELMGVEALDETLRDPLVAEAKASVLEHYRFKYPHNPEGVLAFHVARLRNEGKTTKEALLELKRQLK